KSALPLPAPGARTSTGHDVFTHFYHAQTAHALGEGGWARLFPNDRQEEALTWSRYREAFFNTYKDAQQKDGSWTGGLIGPVFDTAVIACVLQLDRNTLPLFRR